MIKSIPVVALICPLAGVYCEMTQSEVADVDSRGLNSCAVILPIIIGSYGIPESKCL